MKVVLVLLINVLVLVFLGLMVWLRVTATIGMVGFLMSEFIYIEEKITKHLKPDRYRFVRYPSALIDFGIVLYFIWWH